jgi:secreted trypsin-like serine protease
MPENQPVVHDTARNESTRTHRRSRAWLAAWITGLLAAIALVGPAVPAQAIYNSQNPNAIAFSWVVKLEITYGKKRDTCSGSLITPYAVLTAAHCLTQGTPAATKVIFHSGLAGREYSVSGSRIYIQPGYNAVTGNNDVAVLYLVTGVSHNEQLATLGTAAPSVSSTVLTAGYGAPTPPARTPWPPGVRHRNSCTPCPPSSCSPLCA